MIIYNIVHLLAINHQNQNVVLDALMKRMLALCYMHVTFLLKVRSDLVDSDLLQENTLTGKKSTFSFREKNHIQNHHKASNTGGNYITFNFVLLLIKGKEGLQ